MSLSMKEALVLNVHSLIYHSTVNGPGRRAVIHTQGCSLGCPGCFNPLTHDSSGGTAWKISELFDTIMASRPDGITLSGGEPTEQLPAVVALCHQFRQVGLSILMFSGRTLSELEQLPLGPELLGLLDVLIDGRFEHDQVDNGGLRGSTNQCIHLLTRRHSPDELSLKAVEFYIAPNGQVRISGFPSPQLAQSLRRRLEGKSESRKV